MPKIKVECIIRREGGSRVTIGKNTYHFKPQADGAHVCEIDHPPHLSRLLSISEGYRVYDPDLVDEPAQEPEPAPEPKPAPVTTEPQPAAPESPVDPDAEELPSLEGMSRVDLEATFLREVGRAPHPKAKEDTLIAQIVAVRMDRANGGA